MPRVLHKIRDPQTEQINLNNNFDKISQDLADRSGVFSTTATVVGGLSIASGASQAVQVSIKDSLNRFESNSLPVIGRLDIYLDNDQDRARYWPFGSAITDAEVHDIRVSMYQLRTIWDEDDNEKATYSVLIRNDDSVTHDFYFYFDAYYVPGPDKGVAIR